MEGALLTTHFSWPNAEEKEDDLHIFSSKDANRPLFPLDSMNFFRLRDSLEMATLLLTRLAQLSDSLFFSIVVEGENLTEN
jgi:hypothetical protein